MESSTHVREAIAFANIAHRPYVKLEEIKLQREILQSEWMIYDRSSRLFGGNSAADFQGTVAFDGVKIR